MTMVVGAREEERKKASKSGYPGRKVCSSLILGSRQGGNQLLMPRRATRRKEGDLHPHRQTVVAHCKTDQYAGNPHSSGLKSSRLFSSSVGLTCTPSVFSICSFNPASGTQTTDIDAARAACTPLLFYKLYQRFECKERTEHHLQRLGTCSILLRPECQA